MSRSTHNSRNSGAGSSAQHIEEQAQDNDAQILQDKAVAQALAADQAAAQNLAAAQQAEHVLLNNKLMLLLPRLWQLKN
jgi:hypothetical protein